MVRRGFSEIKKNSENVPGKQESRHPALSSAYRQINSYFPKLIPRLIRFTWSDLVIYCEVFFIGLMVYIHFIDA